MRERERETKSGKNTFLLFSKSFGEDKNVPFEWEGCEELTKKDKEINCLFSHLKVSSLSVAIFILFCWLNFCFNANVKIVTKVNLNCIIFAVLKRNHLKNSIAKCILYSMYCASGENHSIWSEAKQTNYYHYHHYRSICLCVESDCVGVNVKSISKLFQAVTPKRA